ncbi:MAG: beta-N-acetylglucosaminidase, partial [Pelobium sp.]
MIKKFLLASTLFLSVSLFACGQEHQKSENWLTGFNQAEKTTVLLNNDEGVLPLKNLEGRKIACIDLGFSHHIVLDSMLNKYSKADHFNGNMYHSDHDFKGLVDELKFYNTVILSLSDVSVFDEDVMSFILEMQQKKTAIVALFGDGKSLTKLNSITAP